MAKKHIRHVRHEARQHEKRHLHLKDLLKKDVLSEHLLSIFLSTFVIVLSSVVIFFNWGKITSVFTPSQSEKPTIIASPSGIQGFKTGLLTTFQVNGQTADQYIRFLRRINTEGYRFGIRTVAAVGTHEEEISQKRVSTLLASVTISHDLSRGKHLSKLYASQAKTLQKSIIATIYLGKKTITLQTAIQTDTQLLSSIKNALEVDLFAYLDQSTDRANSLDDFLQLLDTLADRAQVRSSELQSQINFLASNFEAQDRSLELSEEAFFQNLKIFDGENADQQLADFIGLSQEQSEVRAKIGAYKGLKDYYDYFLPLLENLTRAIRLNRDPLIAGVKVVEVENMTLPLIVPEQSE